MRNLSMKKFGTPIGAGPGSASERVGFVSARAAVGVGERVGLALDRVGLVLGGGRRGVAAGLGRTLDLLLSVAAGLAGGLLRILLGGLRLLRGSGRRARGRRVRAGGRARAALAGGRLRVDGDGRLRGRRGVARRGGGDVLHRGDGAGDLRGDLIDRARGRGDGDLLPGHGRDEARPLIRRRGHRGRPEGGHEEACDGQCDEQLALGHRKTRLLLSAALRGRPYHGRIAGPRRTLSGEFRVGKGEPGGGDGTWAVDGLSLPSDARDNDLKGRTRCWPQTCALPRRNMHGFRLPHPRVEG